MVVQNGHAARGGGGASLHLKRRFQTGESGRHFRLAGGFAVPFFEHAVELGGGDFSAVSKKRRVLWTFLDSNFCFRLEYSLGPFEADWEKLARRQRNYR